MRFAGQLPANSSRSHSSPLRWRTISDQIFYRRPNAGSCSIRRPGCLHQCGRLQKGAAPPPGTKWFEFARKYVAERWEDDAAKTREGICDALATATLALLSGERSTGRERSGRPCVGRWYPVVWRISRRNTRTSLPSWQNTLCRWPNWRRPKCRYGSARNSAASLMAAGRRRKRRKVGVGRSTRRSNTPWNLAIYQRIPCARLPGKR